MRRNQRIIAGVKEANLRAEDLSGAGGFGEPNLLHAFNGHIGLFPGALALATLSERKAENTDTITARCIERDGATRAPYKISGVCADNENCFVIGHSSK